MMFLHLVFLLLGLVVNSAAYPSSTVTDLPANDNFREIEWAAANVSLPENSFELGFNERIGESLSDVWDLPAGLLFCNFSTESTITHNYVETLVNGPYAGMANSALLRANGGELWKVTHKVGVRQGTQIFICNFGKYDVPFSVAEYNIIDAILNEHCQDWGGWVLILDWQLMLGRDATNEDGSFRYACGNPPPPRSQEDIATAADLTSVKASGARVEN